MSPYERTCALSEIGSSSATFERPGRSGTLEMFIEFQHRRKPMLDKINAHIAGVQAQAQATGGIGAIRHHPCMAGLDCDSVQKPNTTAIGTQILTATVAAVAEHCQV